MPIYSFVYVCFILGMRGTISWPTKFADMIMSILFSAVLISLFFWRFFVISVNFTFWGWGHFFWGGGGVFFP